MKKSDIDIAQYTFILYRLGKMGVSQASVAIRLGVTPAYINMVIQGKRDGSDIKDKLAKELGYASWASMRCAVEDFEAKLRGADKVHA